MSYFRIEPYLPHKAEYLTLMIMSVGSTILGMGRSSSSTFNVPLKTTAFIVFFDMVLFGLLAIDRGAVFQFRSLKVICSAEADSFESEVRSSKKSDDGTSRWHKRRSRDAGYL
jgi:hypothetical protein